MMILIILFVSVCGYFGAGLGTISFTLDHLRFHEAERRLLNDHWGIATVIWPLTLSWILTYNALTKLNPVPEVAHDPEPIGEQR